MKVAVNTAKLLRNVPLPDEIATVHDNAVIIDIGSGNTRIGFSGDDAPRLDVPTVYGQAPDGTVDVFAKAYKQRATIPLQNVVERGLVKNWDGMEHLLTHINNLLGISKDTNTPILLSEQREQMVQLLFEKQHVSTVYFATAPVLSLYASGRTSGMVVEMGHGTCHTVPIFEGFGLFHSILQLDFGGDDLTQWLGKNVSKITGSAPFPAYHQRGIFQYLKEVHCPVVADHSMFAGLTAESNKADVVHHTMPDNTVITLGTERYVACEAFFDPSLLTPGGGGGRDSQRGIHNLAVDSARKCDQDVAPILYGNIVLSGGSSLFSGLPNRLTQELQELAPSEKIRLFAATERRTSAFVGGSILASLPTFQDMWVTKADYDEIGPSVAQRNCF